MGVSPIPEIIEEFQKGRPVIIVDDEDRENEGDLIVAAEYATPEIINFMIKHARGLVCLTLTESMCHQLDLPLMVQENRSLHHTNFTVSIEAAKDVTTGISAFDRAKTIAAAVADNAVPADLVQPGHIFPLMAKKGGVLVRAGHTEAGCDLATLAGLKPASVLCEIVNDDGTMSRMPSLIKFAKEHNLKIGTVSDLIEYRSRTETFIEQIADKNVETHYGPARLMAFLDKTTGMTHLALIFGKISPDVETRVRVHIPVSILESDMLGINIGRGYPLEDAMQKISEGPEPGVLLLLRQPETEEKILQLFKAPQTVEAETRWDPRIYGIGAQILKAIGVNKMRLCSAPKKMPSMSGFGLEITGYEPAQDA